MEAQKQALALDQCRYRQQPVWLHWQDALQKRQTLTSIYAELGETRVKVGDRLAALDAVGSVGANRSFYFELRHDEEPINPLVWLAPARTSELSSRHKF